MRKMENVEDLRKIYSCTTITPELYNYSMYGRTTVALQSYNYRKINSQKWWIISNCC